MAATAELNVVSEDTNHGGRMTVLRQAQHDSASTVLRQAQHDSASTVLRQAQHDSAKCFDRLSMTAQMVAENTNHGGNGRIECG